MGRWVFMLLRKSITADRWVSLIPSSSTFSTVCNTSTLLNGPSLAASDYCTTPFLIDLLPEVKSSVRSMYIYFLVINNSGLLRTFRS